jgi:hypothetical protein
MKKTLFLFALLVSLQGVSQEKLGKPFLTGSANFTLGINENYTLNSNDDEPFLVPAALFLRTGFGYEFKRRVALSFNIGFDYHWNYAVSAFPTFGNLKFNIIEDEDDTFFIDMSYGKMWRPSNNYSNGNYYGFGIGGQIAGEKRWNTVVKLDFHRKGLIGFENNRLDSVSFGIGFSFF